MPEVLGDDGAEGVNGIVPTQPLPAHALEGIPSGVEALGQLGLDDHVDGRMEPEVREIGPDTLVVTFDKQEPLALIEGEPVGRPRRNIRIVPSHVARLSG
jgi:hypothetical protein